MKTIEVYGYSDDNIVVSPSGERASEFGAYGDKPRFLFFSDGTILRVFYGKGDHGIWAIERVKEGTAEFKIKECDDADADRYSDTVWLTGADLCTPGTNTAAPIECWANESGPTADELADKLDGLDWLRLAVPDLHALYRAAVKAGAL